MTFPSLARITCRVRTHYKESCWWYRLTWSRLPREAPFYQIVKGKKLATIQRITVMKTMILSLFNLSSAQSIKKHVSLEDEVAASVRAELAEEASNRAATYNNCSVKHNARPLHRYFLAKHNWVNLTNKQRYISISFYLFSNMHPSVSYHNVRASMTRWFRCSQENSNQSFAVILLQTVWYAAYHLQAAMCQGFESTFMPFH